jgi:hypothetical protein
MATQVKARTRELYGQDLYAWSKTQADLLRARRFAELDLDHLIEEIEDVGGALRRSARNRIRTIVEHLLKLEHSPATDPPAGWRATVRTQRIRLRDALSPTLRSELESELSELYGDGRALAEAHSATTARTPRPTSSLQPAPTASTRSPATGCRSSSGMGRLRLERQPQRLRSRAMCSAITGQ